MDRRNFAFDRINFLLIAVSMVVVVIGFVLMSGGGSDANKFDPSIFSTTRTTVAPLVCFIGFVSMIYGVMRKPKDPDTKE